MSTSTDVRTTGGGLLALSGVAFVILVVVAIVGVGGDTPSEDATAAQVVSFYQDEQNRQMIAAFILAASVPFLAVFAATLALAVWPLQTRSRRVWPILLAGGSFLAGGAFILAAFIHFVLAAAADKVAITTLHGFNLLDADSWMAFNSALGVMMLGAGGALIACTGAYRVLAWIALLAGVALFIPFADFFALLVTGIWIIVISIMLFRGEPASAAVPQPA